MAAKAREALQSAEGIESAIVDTTGRAILRLKDGAKPSEDKWNEALSAANNALKVRKLQKRKLETAAAVVTVKLDGKFG